MHLVRLVGLVLIAANWNALIGVDSALLRAQNNQEPAGSRDVIELPDCRVKAVKTAELATDRPGVLAVVDLKEGDHVKEGQVVARLMDEVPQANLAVAKLIAETNVEIEYAEKLNAVDAAEYAKALEANQKHTNTVTDIEVRRLNLAQERSRLQIDKARHETAVNILKAKQAEAELNTYRILAPFDGVVTKIYKFKGEAVKQGDPILDLVNTEVVQVEGMVKARDIWRVKRGARVAVRLNVSGGDLGIEQKVFEGKIGFVDVVSHRVTQETRVWAEVQNPANILRAGLKARMTISVNSAATANLRLPPERRGLARSTSAATAARP